MNIALLSTGFLGKKEATAITVTDFAKELMKQKNKVTIISEKRTESARTGLFEGIPIYRIGFPKEKMFSKFFKIYNKLFAHVMAVDRMEKKSKASFEVIHNFSAAPLLSLRLILLKLFGKKAEMIQTLKSYSREKNGKSFYKLLNWVDVVTVPTKVFANKLISRGVKKNQIRIIRSHINVDKFYPRPKDLLKQKYGLKNKKIVLYYGSMWKNKGTDVLIKAMPSVIKSNSEALFIFIPRNIPYANRYKPVLTSSGQVKFIEQEVNLPEYVSMADVVVLPYLSLVGTEGNPSCLLEAMACKTPVITTSLPELMEIAEGSVEFVEPAHVDSLAAAINRILVKPDLKKIEKAYLEAKKYSVEKISAEFLKLYETAY